MNGKICFGSVLAVLVLILVPATNAIQIQPTDKVTAPLVPSWQTVKTMDSAALQMFLQTLVQNDPVLRNALQQQMKELDRTTVSLIVKGSSKALQGTQSNNGSNQTLLEKMFWKIFNYRLFRFYVSVLIYAVHPTKLTTLRVLTWGIKLLRISQLGVLLGFIASNPQPPTQPEITFQQDLTNKTLTVVTASTGIHWSDIDQIGSGHCDPLPTGTVLARDQITNCTGFIVLRFIPTNTILGYFEFP